MTLSAVAEHYLTDHRGCQNCGEPVNDQVGGKAWIHTLTGSYRCQPSAAQYVGGDGFAMPYDPSADEDALAEAEQLGSERGYEQGKEEGFEEGDQHGHDRGFEEGRKEGLAEAERDMHDAVRSYLNELSPSEIAALPTKVRNVFKGVWDATKLEHS